MARARVIRKQDRCYIELPKEFLAQDEVELFQLRDGYYFLSMPLERMDRTGIEPAKPEGPSAARNGTASEAEISVLHKLQSIKFSDRTTENVARALSAPEKETLVQLEKKGWVNLFRGDKYRNGVYNIADKVYPMLGKAHGAAAQEEGNRDAEPRAQDTKPKTQNPGPQAAPSQQLPPSYALLMKQGYMVIREQKDAKAMSEMLKTEMKSGSVSGTKGFDGAFYVVTKKYFDSASRAVLDCLRDKPADVQAIAGASGLDADGAMAVLQQLAESGDVIEKRKGTYAAV